MDKKRVLFISQEITPYLCETEISTKCRHLPQGIMEKGKDIRIFMPKYGCINERRNQLHEVIRLSGMNMILDNLDYPNNFFDAIIDRASITCNSTPSSTRKSIAFM